MILLIILLSSCLQSLSATEYFHYYAFSKSNESLHSLIEREFIISKKKEVNYAFYLKVMKENSRIKNFDKLHNERIYFRLPKVDLSDEDKSKVSIHLEHVQKFFIDELVSNEEAFRLELKLTEYLYKKQQRKIAAYQKTLKLNAAKNLTPSRAPATIASPSNTTKSVEEFLEDEKQFIEENSIETN